MRLTRNQILDEFRRIEASRGRTARRRKPAAPWAVCLIGYRQRVPRTFNDNFGAWPVRCAVTKKAIDKPRPEVVKREDLAQPLHEIVVLEHVYVPTEAHAKRLKAALDRALLGSSDHSALRHGWRDLPPAADPEIIWPILLEEALADIRRRGEEFSVSVETSRRAAR